MAQLTADKGRAYKATVEPIFNDLAVAATVNIFEGSAVGIVSASGLARQLVAADVFEGFAEEVALNNPGAASAIRVRVRRKGIITASVTGVSAATSLGATVAMSDGDVFTTTTTANTTIGRVARWLGGSNCEVYFEAASIRSI